MADPNGTTQLGVSQQPIDSPQPDPNPAPPAGDPDGDTPGSEPTEDQPPRQLTPREMAMQAIVEKRKQQAAQEAGETAAEAPPAAPPEPPQAAPQGEPAPASPAAQPDPGRKVVLKVNGQDVEMGEADVLRNAQLGLSSTQKFQQASELSKQASAIIARARELGISLDPNAPPPQRQPQPNPPAQAPAPAGPTPPPAITLKDEDVAKTIEAIQYGNAEDGKRLLKGLIESAVQGRAQPGANPQELYERVAPVVAQHVMQQVEYREALATFGREFAPIVNDGQLARLTADRVHEIRYQDAQAGIRRPEIEVFRQAGKETVEAFRKRYGVDILASAPPPAAQPTPQPGAPTLAEKQAAKEALPPTPSAATARAVLGQPAQQPKTPAEIVAQMQMHRRRGQGFPA